MRRFGLGLLLLVLTGSAVADSGWARYRLFIRDANEAQRVGDSSLGLFSEDVIIGETDVIVGPNDAHELLRLQIPFTFVSVLPDPKGWDQGATDAIDYRNQYFRYGDIISQYDEWRAQAPTRISREQIGTSWNNRPIYAYRMATQGRDPVTKSVVIICGIHAREWISPSVGMHIFERMKNILTRPATLGAAQPGAPRLPKGTAFYFIPVLNPDGYEYSWTNNRYWRKNRRNNGNGTYGVDLNRNFSTGWGGTGSSSNPSSETYRGPSAFSEPETNGFRNWLATIPQLVGFIDFHSYGQYVLWPWAYISSLPPGDAWLRATGYAMRDAIQGVNGKTYTAGPSATTLYISSGSSKDYTYDEFEAASYSIELRDEGQFGFVLPENQITPTQNEAWAGYLKFAERVLVR
jgi:murein tripeptide amidase MpaA